MRGSSLVEMGCLVFFGLCPYPPLVLCVFVFVWTGVSRKLLSTQIQDQITSPSTSLPDLPGNRTERVRKRWNKHAFRVATKTLKRVKISQRVVLIVDSLTIIMFFGGQNLVLSSGN